MSQSFDLANGFAAEEYTEVLQTDCCTGKVIEDHCQEGNMVTNGGLLKLPNLWLNDVQQMDLGFARLQPDFFHPIGIEIETPKPPNRLGYLNPDKNLYPISLYCLVTKYPMVPLFRPSIIIILNKEGITKNK